MLTYLSLFSGIGGLDLAVEAFGFRCVGQVEYDPACSATLVRHWPDVPRWGDVHEFTAAAYAEVRGLRCGEPSGTARLAESDGTPDLICGGYPCQPFSHAGKRGGTDDPRHLWPEFARVARELGPRWLLLENVPGHLSLGAREVLGDLAEIGYDARWITVRASDTGAPHRRERWFCLAERTDADGERFGLGGPGPLAEGDRRKPQLGTRGLGEGAPDAGGRSLAWPSSAGDGLPESAERGAFAWGAYAPAIERWERVMGPSPAPVDEKGRLAPPFVEWMQGFPSGWTDGMTRTQALKALGNAVVPQQALLALEILTDVRDNRYCG